VTEARPRRPAGIERTPRFDRRAKKLLPDQQAALARALRLFMVNAHDPLLGTHKLSKDSPMKGLWAFGFGFDLRVVFDWDGDIAVLLNVGTHAEVYG
jgi:mRNA-degrading endonuclease YafQ of YafQ-DinJ toxin-antitoxin module